MKRETAEFIAGSLYFSGDDAIEKIMALSFFDSRIAIVRDVPADCVPVLPADEIVDGLVPVIRKKDVIEIVLS